MLPHPLSRSAPGKDPPLPDLAFLLEQHVAAGFPSDLALDLVLNELVVRAADATQATAAALALLRGDQMVCRAATGLHAPDLGIPLDTRDGLSGACLRTRAPQLSSDTENDSRIDPSISRRQGIRSMLIVPVFDHEAMGPDHRPPLTGVLEVFSPLPDTFTHQSQILLSDFGDECARICRVAEQLKTRPPAEVIPLDADIVDSDPASEGTGATPVRFENSREFVWSGENEPVQTPGAEILPAKYAVDPAAHTTPPRQPYEAWTLILGALVILAAAGFSFIIGSRVGWLRASPEVVSSQPASTTANSQPASSPAQSAPMHKDSAKPKAASPEADGAAKSPSASSDQLVVYDKNKVVFRMGPTQSGERTQSTPPAGETSKPESALAKSIPSPARPLHSIWLAPAQAESRLINRVEPQYPPDALADHRAGDVTLEVHVAEDGTVSSVRTLNGDPLLAAAAAEAVRNWRYQPYRANNQPSKFQTDVTLTFSLPN